MEESIDIIVNDVAVPEEAVAEEAGAKDDAKEDTERAAAAAGGRVMKGHKLCKWSWANRQCVPADLCQYKYQVI